VKFMGKTKSTGRRYFGRKRRGGSRRSKIKLLDVFAGIGVAGTLGAFDAAEQAMNGDYKGAGNTIQARAGNPATMMSAMVIAIIPSVGRGMCRKLGASLPRWM
jgi:hypothetical protein